MWLWSKKQNETKLEGKKVFKSNKNQVGKNWPDFQKEIERISVSNFSVQWNSVLTNKFLGKIGYFSTQINPVIANPCYNEKNVRPRAVRYIRVSLYFVKFMYQLDQG